MEETIKKDKKPSVKKFKFDILVKVIIFILFILYTISMIYPFIWSFLASMKGQLEYVLDSWGMPDRFTFENYLLAFKTLSANGKNMFVMILNSLWYCIGTTGLRIFSSVMTAYAVAKYKFVGRNFIYKLAIIIMMIPIVGSLPAQLLMYHRLGIYNNPLILIAYTSGFGFEFLVLYSYFRNLAWSYAEAGFIDGAGHFTVFFKIMVPQAMSAISALALISFIGAWNDYMGPIIFLPDFPTLSAGLYTYQVESERKLHYPMLYAGILMSMAPVLVLFAFFQNTLMEMNIAGGLKE